MALPVTERVKSWRKRESLKRMARYVAGDVPVAANGHSQNIIKRWRKHFIRKALSIESELDFPPIKPAK